VGFLAVRLVTTRTATQKKPRETRPLEAVVGSVSVREEALHFLALQLVATRTASLQVAVRDNPQKGCGQNCIDLRVISIPPNTL
jgi:hypothetical protein